MLTIKKILLLSALTLIQTNGFSQTTLRCVIRTSMGDIHLELYPEKAPKTVANFMEYVRDSSYTNSTFFRVCTPDNEADRKIQIGVIQGGHLSADKRKPAIALETTKETGILHQHGTISMARSTPDSAQSSFFICINKQPELDFNGKRNSDGQGFAAFGKVIKGMDIVVLIQSQKNKDQQLVNPVIIYTIDPSE